MLSMVLGKFGLFENREVAIGLVEVSGRVVSRAHAHDPTSVVTLTYPPACLRDDQSNSIVLRDTNYQIRLGMYGAPSLGRLKIKPGPIPLLTRKGPNGAGEIHSTETSLNAAELRQRNRQRMPRECPRAPTLARKPSRSCLSSALIFLFLPQTGPLFNLLARFFRVISYRFFRMSLLDLSQSSKHIGGTDLPNRANDE